MGRGSEAASRCLQARIPSTAHPWAPAARLLRALTKAAEGDATAALTEGGESACG